MNAFLAPSLRRTAYGLWASYFFGRPYTSTFAMTLMLPLLYNVVEVIAFSTLFLTARRGFAKDISPQTIVALSASPLIDIFRKMRWYLMWYDACRSDLEVPCGSPAWWGLTIGPTVVAVSALACTWVIMKNESTEGDDDLINSERPSWLRWATPYLAAGGISLVVSLCVCYMTGVDVIFSRDDAFLATFENFLHGLALLPQLVLCRRRGFVSPAAVKFLLIIGIKHVMEVSIDVWSSSFAARNGTSHSDASYLLGDLCASFVLLDFMYLWSLQTYKVGVRKSMNKCIDLTSDAV